MVKDAICLKNCPNGKICTALGKVMQSSLTVAFQISIDLFLTDTREPIEKVLKLVNSSLFCENKGFSPMAERIVCQLPDMSNISFSCSGAYEEQFEEELTALLNTNVSRLASPLTEVDTLYQSIVTCGISTQTLSCSDSGSGLLLQRFQGGFSWEGPLSFYRGCQNEF